MSETAQFYWHVNNAISKVVPNKTRPAGGGKLTLVDASRFGQPTPAAPIRVSIFRDGSPLTILRCVGRDGDELTIDGAVDNYPDVECLPGDLAANTPTAGDFNMTKEAIAALQASPPFVAVVDDQSRSWLAHIPAFRESSASSIVREVSGDRGLPVTIVDPVVLSPADVVLAGEVVNPREFQAVNVAAAGDNVIVPGVVGHHILVMRWGVTAHDEVVVVWKSGATPITGPRPLTKFASAGAAYCPIGVFQTEPDEPLVLESSTNAVLGGEIVYVLVPENQQP